MDKDIRFDLKVESEVEYLRRKIRYLEQRLGPGETQPPMGKDPFQRALETLVDGMWDCDLERGSAYYSPQWGEMLGLAPEEIPAYVTGFFDNIHPDDRETVEGALSRHLAGETPVYVVEMRLRTASGAWQWTRTRGRVVERDGNGRALRMIGGCTDITARRELELELERQRQLWRTMVENAPFGALYVLFDETVGYASPAFTRITGYAPEDVPDHDTLLRRLFTDRETRESIRRALPRLKAEGHGRREFDIRCKDGSTRHFEVRATYLPNDDVLLTFFDLTEHRRLERELVTAKEQAEAGSRAKSLFLTRMSHELRTPLNILLGMNELLQETELNAEQRHLLTLAKDAGDNLLALVNDSLDLSRIEAGRMRLEEKGFSPAKLVADTLSIFERQAREKGLPLDFAPGPDTREQVLGDPFRLRQILVNLVGNAVKFTDAGRVEVALHRLPGGKGEPAAYRIEVADTGVGVPEEMAERIFDHFVQADSTPTRRFGGSGLGLAIARELAGLMGGKVDFEHRQGGGSLFRLELPLVPADPGSHEIVANPPDKTMERQAPGLRILLAEDNDSNAILVRHYLKGTGHTLDVAGDGAKALELFASASYDLVLMDLEMPVLDGFEAARRIRSLEKRTGAEPVPIVALTAHAFADHAREALEAGMSDHEPKPLRKKRLLELIAQHGR